MYKELLSQRFVFKAPQSYCIGELLLVIQVKYKGIFAVIWFEKKNHIDCDCLAVTSAVPPQPTSVYSTAGE